MKFEEFDLSKETLESIKLLGFEEATLIQEKSIPPILEGNDILGESATGSGKTLAFGCALIENIEPKKGLQGLVLTPTRELAEQVKKALLKLGKKKKLKIISIYGGVAIEPQIRDMFSADIVVATPGRFLDHLERRTVNTDKVKVFVLDEADRMLDMGFIDDVKKIISTCPNREQTLFFSATMSPVIKELAKPYMKKPIEIFATKMVDPTKLKQVYYDVKKNMKLSLLIHLLKQENSHLIMVFCNTRRATDIVVENLQRNRIKAEAIHGGFSQNKRNNMLMLFNKGIIDVLVCTDVAARGLDIDNVTHVYNYDIPKDPKDYVHRIGRTARAGNEGKVINLLCDYDYGNFSRLMEEYREFNIEAIDSGFIKKLPTISFGNRRSSRSDTRSKDNRNRSRKPTGERTQKKSTEKRNFKKGKKFHSKQRKNN